MTVTSCAMIIPGMLIKIAVPSVTRRVNAPRFALLNHPSGTCTKCSPRRCMIPPAKPSIPMRYARFSAIHRTAPQATATRAAVTTHGTAAS